METKLYFFTLMLLCLIFSAGGIACSAGITSGHTEPSRLERMPSSSGMPDSPMSHLPVEGDMAAFLSSLDGMAELERSGAWIRGMAFTESGLRENSGDYAGAVAAAYKGLSWAYGMGQLQKIDIENGLLNALTSMNDSTVTASVNAIIAFSKGQWNEAAAGLAPLFNEFDEPDGFGRWMMLVCSLEKNKADSLETTLTEAALEGENRRTAAAYKSIRARYTPFPEYWYRGARAFSGAIAADYAETCINTSPQGPFADECRKILASFTGLKIEDGPAIKTKREIETIIAASINSGNPHILNSLLPLIGLPDNPFTVYTVGALRALTGIPVFRDYFNEKAGTSSGRLSERLIYICRS